jgi:hypothetical protein
MDMLGRHGTHYPGSRLANNLLGYLPAHHTVVGRYGYTIEPKGFRQRFHGRSLCEMLP